MARTNTLTTHCQICTLRFDLQERLCFFQSRAGSKVQSCHRFDPTSSVRTRERRDVQRDAELTEPDKKFTSVKQLA
jgi:hypothetical protein